jgi:hypothetical protein
MARQVPSMSKKDESNGSIARDDLGLLSSVFTFVFPLAPEQTLGFSRADA